MTVTGLESIAKFLRDNASARRPLERWLDIAREAEWENIVDARANIPDGRRNQGHGVHLLQHRRKQLPFDDRDLVLNFSGSRSLNC